MRRDVPSWLPIRFSILEERIIEHQNALATALDN